MAVGDIHATFSIELPLGQGTIIVYVAAELVGELAPDALAGALADDALEGALGIDDIAGELNDTTTIAGILDDDDLEGDI